ncbi:hypothetical protein BIV57_20000 [Mangrovactinospora gilvigrisea]|uniref:Uncharacterized protein n=1 Tax=Mangrovactinospora gilvigrisea TaxID=1428644 RepID=A0A1J7BAW5_9ACTN|nr:hypothetical protein [Mangrovactinospora gilvigrisea]OIV35758.1 hypothetical protein BIV57_20000 [Mangrovactinospora gilvigrisea]
MTGWTTALATAAGTTAVGLAVTAVWNRLRRGAAAALRPLERSERAGRPGTESEAGGRIRNGIDGSVDGSTVVQAGDVHGDVRARR